MSHLQLIHELDALRKRSLTMSAFALFFSALGVLVWMAPHLEAISSQQLQNTQVQKLLQFLNTDNLQSLPPWGLPAVFGLAVVFWIASFLGARRYNGQFKREFVPRELAQWIPNLHYRRGSDLDAESFRKIRVCPPHFNRYQSEDSILIESPDLECRFDEVRAELFKKSGKHSSTQVLFQGHLLTGHLPQIPPSLKLRIEPDSRDAFLAQIPKGLQKTLSQNRFFQEDQETVRFDDDHEFEKHYRVVCADPAFTRGFITLELREKLKRHHQATPKHPIALSILDQKLYMAFSRPGNSLEPPWFQSIHQNNTVLSFVADLKQEIEWLRFVLSILA